MEFEEKRRHFLAMLDNTALGEFVIAPEKIAEKSKQLGIPCDVLETWLHNEVIARYGYVGSAEPGYGLKQEHQIPPEGKVN